MLDMHIQPSDLMGIEDAYTAFCFNEACAFIIKQIKDGKEPVVSINNTGGSEYKRPSDLYKKYEK